MIGYRGRPQSAPRLRRSPRTRRHSIERARELAQHLASGAADGLSGHFISVNANYCAMTSQASEIKDGDMHTLRLKTHATSRPPRIFQRQA